MDEEIELSKIKKRRDELIDIQLNESHSSSDSDDDITETKIDSRPRRSEKKPTVLFNGFRSLIHLLSGDMTMWQEWLTSRPFIPWFPLILLDRIFRGVAQVMFINNPISGIIITVALILGDHYVGTWCFLGTIISTLTALALELSETDSRNGLHGFNGCLVGGGIALFTNSDWDILIVGVLLIAPAVCVVVQLCLVGVFKKFKVPAFTFPFVATTWIFLASSYQTSQWNLRIGQNGGGQLVDFEGMESRNITMQGMAVGWLKGISEVYFIDSWISGLMMLLAIFISSPFCALSCAFGSALGVIGGIAYGADEAKVVFGLWGYNPVLACMAIFPVFLKPSILSFFFSLLCGTVTVVVQAALVSLFTVWGLPTLTLAFILTSQIFLMASHTIPKLRG